MSQVVVPLRVLLAFALAVVVQAVMWVRGILKSVGADWRVSLLLVVAAGSIVALFATGAIPSSAKPATKSVLQRHARAPVLGVLPGVLAYCLMAR